MQFLVQCMSVSFVEFSITIVRKGDGDIRNGIVTVALHSSLVVRNVSQQALANRLFHLYGSLLEHYVSLSGRSMTLLAEVNVELTREAEMGWLHNKSHKPYR